MLTTSDENIVPVNSELAKFMKCYHDASEMQESFINLPLPQDEVTRQNEYFRAKMTVNGDFTEKVKRWLSDMGHSYVQPKTDLPDD